MKPPPFGYIRPHTLDDALSALSAEGDDAKVLAGGQSLIAMMNLRLVSPRKLVDINRLTELDYIRIEDGDLAIGAMTRLAAAETSPVVAESCPLMAQAIGYVAHRPIRNRGTIGGNLSQADPSSELPAVAVALDAELVVRKSGAERRIAAEDFFVGALTTAMAADELLTEIRFPAWSDARGWSFMEVSPRKGDYALVGVATTLTAKDGTCEDCRFVFTGDGERARRITQAEEAVRGRPVSPELCAEAGRIAAEHVRPTADLHADEAYRRDLAQALGARSLEQAMTRCRPGG